MWCLDFPRCRLSFWESECFPNLLFRIGVSTSLLVSYNCFSNCRTCFPWAAVLYFVFCFFTFGIALPHVYRTFGTFVLLCFLIVLVSSFAAIAVFQKNVFFLKMFFHLVWLTNLMVLMMMSTCWPSRYHTVHQFLLNSPGSWSGPLRNFCFSDKIWLTLVMPWQSSNSLLPWAMFGCWYLKYCSWGVTKWWDR